MKVISSFTEGEYQREKERLLAALYVFGSDCEMGKRIQAKLIQILRIRNLSDVKYKPIKELDKKDT